MKKLLVVALEKELPRDYVPDDYNIIYTGIGKVNAAIVLTKALTSNPFYDVVINYGTAGATDQDVSGELLDVGWVMERDMDLTVLGLPKYVVRHDQKPMIATSNLDTEIVCGTGDSFDRPQLPYHIVDMEAYALAKVCKKFGIIFKCYKYISDTDDDEDPGEAWKENVSKGAEKFLKVITKD
jgi:adenosylhomocysteine nucleosidase